MINIIGLGYIGLPTALIFAEKGFAVIGTDTNKLLINKLKNGEITFEEKGLVDLFNSSTKKDLTFSDKLHKSEIYLVAVPTPYDKFTKKIDPNFVVKAIEQILSVCDEGTIIIIESTVSPGTIHKYIRPVIFKSKFELGKNIHLVHAPERIIPGNMIYELEHNARTIGADSYEIGEKVAQIYRKITDGEVIVTDIKTAEMTKVVENTFRAVNIAFANELARICRHDNMNVYEIIKICNMHPRVKILNPGPGVGGHCIPVDPWFLVGDYPTLTNVIWESLKTNESMPDYVLFRIKEIMDEKGLKDFGRVGLYGLTYKENVDDYRESPSLQLLEKQIRHLSYPLKSYDPWVKKDIVENQYHDFDKFLHDVDLVVVMVKHDEIIINQKKMLKKVVFDTQNILSLPNIYTL